jgi:hypothetical protein
VSRYIVGQGRTYIRAKDGDAGKIDVEEVVANFRAGRVMVSYGLLAEITVNDKYGPGNLVPAAEKVNVHVRVLGPGWTTADKVELFANGRKIRESEITDGKKAGVKWSGEWVLPRFKHDVHLVAVASGPAMRELYWPIAKPYQPISPQFNLRVVGSTGAVWIDGDGDGKRSCARDYARLLLERHGKELGKFLPALADYDEAVAAQAAGLLHGLGVAVTDAEVLTAAKKSGPAVERGFGSYFEAWRQCQIAREQKP